MRRALEGALRNAVGKGKDPRHQPAPGHQADERSPDGSGWEGGGPERGVPKDGLGTPYPVPQPQAPSARQSELGTNAQGRASQWSPRKHRSVLAGHPRRAGTQQPLLNLAGEQGPGPMSPVNRDWARFALRREGDLPCCCAGTEQTQAELLSCQQGGFRES